MDSSESMENNYDKRHVWIVCAWLFENMHMYMYIHVSIPLDM